MVELLGYELSSPERELDLTRRVLHPAIKGSRCNDRDQFLDGCERQGEQAVMPELRGLLDTTPDLWRQLGDIAKHVEATWVKLLAGNDLLTQECLHREAERRRTELLGDDPTPIERHLIETIVASWLQVKHAEMQMGNSRDATDTHLTFLHRRLESAQKQHRAAINQLVKVREVTTTKKQEPSGSTRKSGEMKRPGKRTRHRVVAA